MIVIPMLLERTNTMLCGGQAIGSYVDISGSPALWSERSGDTLDVVVLHYMSDVVAHPLAPYAPEHIIEVFSRCGVSAHYVIDRGGRVFYCVPEDKKAWHAGGSIMPLPDNRTAVNDFSIGIELLATVSSGFTELQYLALLELCVPIEKRRNIKMTYVGHDQIADKRAVAFGLRKDIKSDPGPLFDWLRFFDGLKTLRQGDD